MNTNDDFSVEELIYLFVDGEASKEEKEILFNALSKEPELANEFHYALMMQKAAVATSQLAAPPFSLTNSIFVKAGLTVATSAGITGIFASIKNLLNTKTAYATISGLICSLSTYLALEYFSPKFSSIDKSNNNNELTANELQTKKVEKEVPFITQNNNLNLKNKILKQNKQNELKAISNINDDNLIKQNNSENLVANSFNENSRLNVPMINHLNVVNKISLNNNGNYIPANIIANTIADNKSDNQFILNIGTIQGIGLSPYRAFADEKNSILENYDISLIGALGKDYYIGARVIKENFPIYTRDSKGEYKYEPFIASFGVTVQKSFSEYTFLENLMPFADAYIGYTKQGNITKLGLGVIWESNSLISMKLGVNGTSLLYKNDGTLKHTEKLGLTYSVGIGF